MKEKSLFKRYALYLIRWQLSTPILAVVLIVLTNLNEWVATIIANFIGGLIFFWVDKWIFRKKSKLPLWEIKENAICCDCNKECEGYRIVSWGNYDKTNEKNPKFRCHECSLKKMTLVEPKANSKPKKTKNHQKTHKNQLA